jgi:hypothetical protein
LSFYENRRIWRCHGCKKQFSIKVGTIFEDSPIGFDKWLPAIWLIANSKNSVSSHELGRALSITQKTAWFMLHRIREAMITESFTKMNGTVEVDETYIGGEAKNIHEYKRVAMRAGGKRVINKVPVQGARQRETGKVTAKVVTKGTYKSNVEKWVSPGTTVYTDQASAYRGLSENYVHDYVTHGREYVRGNVHTNGIENFWALLKRALKGTQVHCDVEHLPRYVVERVFSYNNREMNDLERLYAAMGGVVGRRLTYAELTGKV